MTTKEFLDGLRNKRRTVEDITRFVTSRADHNPNYNLLLGAGCSVSSGIDSGRVLVEKWRRSMYERLAGPSAQAYSLQVAVDFLTQHHGVWYNPANEYSSLFEKHYDLPRQRRMFIEQQVAGRFPSIGYVYLIRLIEAGLFRTIFTTNFDDLINETFYQFSKQRPMVCAHDSTVQSILVTSQRPKVIKLHGDYLFDDIKSTVRETESLEENTRHKLQEFSKDFGLIVIGYNGADRSVLDVLNYMLRREEFLTSGIYWCLREKDEIHDEVKKLLWRDRVYYVLIDGFDELMAELYESHGGETSPIQPTIELGTSQLKLEQLIANIERAGIGHPLIAKHLRQLKRESQHNSMYALLDELTDSRDIKVNSDEPSAHPFTNEELQNEMRLRVMMKNGDLEEAERKARRLVEEARTPKVRAKFLGTLVDIYTRQERLEEGTKVCQTLRDAEPYNPKHLLEQVNFERSIKDKLSLLDEALRLNPCFVQALNKMTEIGLDHLTVRPEKRSSDLPAIEKTVLRSIAVDPDPRNPAWMLAQRVAKAFSPDVAETRKQLIKYFERLKQHDAWSPAVFDYRLEIARVGEVDRSQIEQILEDLKTANERSFIGEDIQYEMLILDCLASLRDRSSILAKFGECDERFASSSTYILERARITLSVLRDPGGAIDMLRRGYETTGSFRVVRRCIKYLVMTGRFAEATSLLESLPATALPKVVRLDFQADIALGQKEYDRALQFEEQKRLLKDEEDDGVTGQTFILLCAGRNNEAEELVKRFLDGVAFNAEYASDIVNYELARQRLGKNVSKGRLNTIVTTTGSELEKFSACLLLQDFEGAHRELSAAIDKDYGDKLLVRTWPVTELMRGQPKLERLLMTESEQREPARLQSVT